MKLIINQENEIEDPPRLQVKSSFGLLFRNPGNSLEFKKSQNERLVFKWDRYIGLKVELVSYNDEIIQKDSVPFLSFNRAINAAKLFTKGSKAWQGILKMKTVQSFNSKNIIRRVIKGATYTSLVALPVFYIFSILIKLNSNHPAVVSFMADESNPPFYLAFAFVFYAWFFAEIPSFAYRDDFGGNSRQKMPLPILLIILMSAVMITVMAFSQ